MIARVRARDVKAFGALSTADPLADDGNLIVAFRLDTTEREPRRTLKALARGWSTAQPPPTVMCSR